MSTSNPRAIAASIGVPLSQIGLPIPVLASCATPPSGYAFLWRSSADGALRVTKSTGETAVISGSGTKAGAPDANDDASDGYVVGSVLVDTSATPRRSYTCTDATAAAAVWVAVGAALVAFATSGNVDQHARLDFASSPVSAITSTGIIGGP